MHVRLFSYIVHITAKTPIWMLGNAPHTQHHRSRAPVIEAVAFKQMKLLLLLCYVESVKTH